MKFLTLLLCVLLTFNSTSTIAGSSKSIILNESSAKQLGITTFKKKFLSDVRFTLTITPELEKLTHQVTIVMYSDKESVLRYSAFRPHLHKVFTYRYNPKIITKIKAVIYLKSSKQYEIVYNLAET